MNNLLYLKNRKIVSTSSLFVKKNDRYLQYILTYLMEYTFADFVIIVKVVQTIYYVIHSR